MISALPPIPSPVRHDAMPGARRSKASDPIKSQQAKTRHSYCDGSWTCWPARIKGNKTTRAHRFSIPETVEAKRQAGFTLFAVPPTPPTRKYYLTRREYIDDSGKFLQPSETDETSPSGYDNGSLPASLHPQSSAEWLRDSLNTRKDRPSYRLSTSRRTSLCRRPLSSTYKRTSLRATIIHPTTHSKQNSCNMSPTHSKRGESRLSRLHSRAGLLGKRHKHAMSNSTSVNQWFDIEEGLVDRRKLSIYLGDVWGSSFQIPNLNHMSDHAQEPVTLDNVYLSKEGSGPLNLNPPVLVSPPRPCTATRCECSPGRVLCQGKSSPEFAAFSIWPTFRKSHLSVSSTACRLQIPRAQLPPSPPKPKSPTKPRYKSPLKLESLAQPDSPLSEELALPSSPPELVFDDPAEGEDLDWSLVRSSPREDVFNCRPNPAESATPFVREALASTRNGQRYSSAPLPGSRPPPSAFKPIKTKTARPQTPDTTAAVTSSCSSFEFEFDFDREKHFQQPPSADKRRTSRRVVHRHLRTVPAKLSIDDTKPSHRVSEILEPVKVATVARSLAMKPTLITHRTCSSPMPTVQDGTTISGGNGVTVTRTEIKIQRPSSQINTWKRRGQIGAMSIPETGMNPVGTRNKQTTRIPVRPASRLSNNGSPVLGKTSFNYPL